VEGENFEREHQHQPAIHPLPLLQSWQPVEEEWEGYWVASRSARAASTSWRWRW
jgi:hypothetical protein